MSRYLFAGVLLFSAVLLSGESGWASFVIHSQVYEKIKLKGYSDLHELNLFEGTLIGGEQQVIETDYNGLALLYLSSGQHYPLILGNQSFIMYLKGSANQPSFTGSEENELLYNLMVGAEEESSFTFPMVMIRSKNLLEASQSIRTFADLTDMKKQFRIFIQNHYPDLRRSDMLRQLIAQYLMMHEYVSYRIDSTPASSIRERYHQTLLDSVNSILVLLQPHIPAHEILNYCVLLYYNRSMVTLASYIITNFSDFAYCPGDDYAVSFPGNLQLVTQTNRKWVTQLRNIKTEKTISYVSLACPVSLVETVIRARKSGEQKMGVVIVATMEPLSEKHLTMNRMISKGRLLFINDEKWREKNLPHQMKLPSFVAMDAR